MFGYLFLVLVAAAVVAAYFGGLRALAVSTTAGTSRIKAHSRPIYHGLNAAIWTAVPASIFLLLWLAFQSSVVNQLVLASYPGSEGMDSAALSLLIGEIRQVAAGNLFRQPTPEVAAAAEHLRSLQTYSTYLMMAIGFCIVAVGAFLGMKVISPRYRARHSVETAVTGFMMFSSLVAIIITVGIVGSLVFEALHFFARVPVTEFLFGLRWEPQIAIRADQVAGQGAFGVLPVLFGTFVISAIAMLVAVPTGILSAIYLTEYAHPRFRAVVKPLLEILAGVPTVVYGFFAVLTVAPAIRALGASVGIASSPNSALATGLVMGVMIIPFISSLSDDAFAAVPRAMRDGSLALGATKGETIRKVLLPAALPGIIGGVLLALSRAVGETMIVVMAAGLIAKITLNPFDAVTTVTVQIVTLLIGDSEFDNPKTLAAFALGLVLFLVTLGLNLIALRTVRKYREKY
ncbi:phosphate ABC transporter permease protein PstC [Rhizobium etli 8C-3]|uniref:Phosphate transport system permease protein n=2 Tax=Rhizobium TaxID=379 RepID=A0A4V2VBN9_9HYPH|nr:MULTISPECIES: phosphate ABC transporter permease subunit PstC [Rhizobium]APO75193.1 phosphate ABC transporter permease protein PstC [Rhizobium etli 8C-3]TCU25665.1 phosphate ABC transporter membrane protein 1 (PhoT family) [Rhizobium azibense]TCU40051.1 phosphate ABC transporter membrane protein 1 (PhoT family) [Rhizobium azibense]